FCTLSALTPLTSKTIPWLALMVVMRTAILLALAFGVADATTDGWVHKFGYSYRMFEHKATFDEAEAWCVAEGGHLVSIHNHEENELLRAITRTGVLPQGYGYFAWIGLRQKDWPKDKKWTWTDGTPVDYLNWAPDEPNNHEDSEHCAQVYNDPKDSDFKGDGEQWNDYNCDAKMMFFVCKKEYVPEC
uniref:C-type lectin domain-containing protein n=1 Tax=Haemonchus contortus TaxID=6289 RepID=A0A7I4YJK7_HAECO